MRNLKMRKYFHDSRFFVGRHFLKDTTKGEKKYWNDIFIFMTIYSFKRNTRAFDFESIVSIGCIEFAKLGNSVDHSVICKFKHFDKFPDRMKSDRIFHGMSQIGF